MGIERTFLFRTEGEATEIVAAEYAESYYRRKIRQRWRRFARCARPCGPEKVRRKFTAAARYGREKQADQMIRVFNRYRRKTRRAGDVS